MKYISQAFLSILFIVSVLTARPLYAEEPNNISSYKFHINIRPVYSFVNTTEHDDTEISLHTMNLRTQLGLRYDFNNKLSFHVRTAMRLASNQDDFRFLIDFYTEESGTYPSGIATIDEFFVNWKVTPELTLIAGRFQGRFPLEGFIPKGIDRYYAANLSISHTDGFWLSWNAGEDWLLHLIGSHNSESGSTHTAYYPLRFDESVASRFSAYANVQHRNTQERWAQRELSASITPHNFYLDDELKHHIALSTRWMYRANYSLSGEEYLIGGELGFIPVAPKPSDAGFQISEEQLLFGSSAFAWQVSAYINEISERHRIGVLYGHTDPHWLISSSFAPNIKMAEFRYRYTITSWINYEFRFRLRDEKLLPSEVNQGKRIFDFYTRFTIRL